MIKTVKDILREAHGIKYQGDSAGELLRKLSNEITEVYEIELAEKDKKIKELKQTQLYKEDFIKDNIICECINKDCDFAGATQYILKDNSKYDKLPSKDVK